MDPRLSVFFLSACSLIMTQMALFLAMKRKYARRRLELRAAMDHFHIQQSRETLIGLIALVKNKPKRNRSAKRTYSQHWWESIVPSFDGKQWIENFRIKEGTFDWICEQVNEILRPHPKPVIPGQAVPVKKIVGIALYKLAHLAEYRVVGNLFGVSKSTVHNCLYGFCYDLSESIGATYIKMPTEEEAQEIASAFESVTHIPQIIGAIDGSHIPITAPRDGHDDFKNRKGYTSFVLQAVVDHQYMFRDISCRVPGSCHDADALRESDLFKSHERFIPGGFKRLGEWDIPYMLIGDPAYPLRPWLLKNYNYDASISPEMDSFNVYLNKGRVVVENAFGRLKGRWRILLRQSDVHYTFVPKVVAACCILHNVCEMSKETFQGNWLQAVVEAEEEYPQPDTIAYNREDQYEVADLRDHIMLHLASNFECLQSIRGRYAQQ